jgi:hypothetical protein
MRRTLGQLAGWWRGHQAAVGVVSISLIYAVGIAAAAWLRWGS